MFFRGPSRCPLHMAARSYMYTSSVRTTTPPVFASALPSSRPRASAKSVPAWTRFASRLCTGSHSAFTCPALRCVPRPVSDRRRFFAAMVFRRCLISISQLSRRSLHVHVLHTFDRPLLICPFRGRFFFFFFSFIFTLHLHRAPFCHLLQLLFIPPHVRPFCSFVRRYQFNSIQSNSQH